MSTSSPSTKRPKTQDAPSSNSSHWRDKCIAKFNLKPVPPSWSDAAPKGTESAWERYYNERSQRQKSHDELCEDKYNSDGDEIDEYGNVIDDDDDDKPESNKDLVQSWKWAMEDVFEENKYLAEGLEWHWIPFVGNTRYDDSKLRSSKWSSTVWSPYAIPHGIYLSHYYHSEPKWSYIDFCCEWEYKLWDFEDEDFKRGELMLLCSNRLDKIDRINTCGLNKTTYKTLRSFLFGTASKESEEVTCTAMNFWRLIFASMGTTDPKLSDTLRYHGCVGYHWEIDDEMRKKLYGEKAVEEGAIEADPNGPFEKYTSRYRGCCSWLRHRLLEITDNLGPVTKYYQGPKLKEDDEGDSDEYGCSDDEFW